MLTRTSGAIQDIMGSKSPKTPATIPISRNNIRKYIKHGVFYFVHVGLLGFLCDFFSFLFFCCCFFKEFFF